MSLRSSSAETVHRVAIINDHIAIVEMMVQVLESIHGYKVVGHAMDLGGALRLCTERRPDIVILNFAQSHGSGLELLGEIQRACPHARSLLFAGNLSPTMLRCALASGVHGMVDRMASLDEFRRAVEAVGAGRIYFTSHVSEQIKQMVAQRLPVAPKQAALSRRERLVLRHIAEGLSSREIAVRLGISVYTVINHRTRLMHKVGLRRAAQLSLYAAEIGVMGNPLELEPQVEKTCHVA